jgi:surfeit locus 1 family protein
VAKGEDADDMVKDPKGSNEATWVPSGLKVRASAPRVEGQASGDPNAADRPSPQSAPTRPPSKAPAFSPMPILTLVTLICLAILYMLGSWQWDKFVQKSNAPATNAVLAPTSVPAALETSAPEYRPVIVDGIIDPRTIKILAVQDGVRGYRLFSPVLLEAGGIFVDRGFVDETNLSKVTPLSGQVSITGVLRSGARANAYTPDNEPASDVWYWPELKAMADIMMMRATNEQFYVAQSQVDPLGTGTPIANPYADPRGAAQIPPERHLGYAATWWGFGIALIGVYIGMHVRTGRLRFSRSPLS